MPDDRLCRFVTVRLRSAVAVLSLAVACKRGEPIAHPDSAATTPATMVDSALVKRARSGWNAAAGPVLLVSGSSREEAIVLFPAGEDSSVIAQLDSASLHQVPVTLFGRGGTRFSAQLGAPSGESTDDCERWPLRKVAPGGGTAWSVGFVRGHVTPLPMDSVDVLSARDSMVLAAEAARLASSVTAPTGPSFQGLRFAARDIRRFEAAPGVQAIMAHLIRRVNQEANPQEEQTLLVAERDSGVTSGSYRLAYAERSFGREEEVLTSDVVAGMHVGGKPTLLIAHDSNHGVVYSLLERTGTRRWRVRWTSSVTHCG
jgi:hypothetical protein